VDGVVEHYINHGRWGAHCCATKLVPVYVTNWKMLLCMMSHDAEMRALAGRPRVRGWLSRKLAITLRAWLVLMLVYILTVSQVKRRAERGNGG
jgi:hypothetical protein